MLMYDGRVFVEGATSSTALYDTAKGTWSAGPNLPVIDGKQFTAADASSALLPDGKVLFELSPAVGVTPTHFFLFDGTTITQIADDPGAANEASNYGYMLLLPTGQVLYDHRQGPSSLELYNHVGPLISARAPHITSVPGQLTRVTRTRLRASSSTGCPRAPRSVTTTRRAPTTHSCRSPTTRRGGSPTPVRRG